MPLIKCKVEFKFKWTNHSVLSDNGNDDAHSNNIIFSIKDTKLYVSVVTLSAKKNQKLVKFPNEEFERSVYWNKTKSENKNTTNEHRYFIKSDFVGVNRLFVLVYSNQDDNAKTYKARRYYLLKGVIKNYNVIISRENFYYQPIDSYIK